MATRPEDVLNDNLAPKSISTGLRYFLRLIGLVGKPFYLILTSPIIFIIIIQRITGYIVRLKFPKIKIKFPKRKVVRKGVIFSSRRFQLKMQFISAIRYFTKAGDNLSKKRDRLSWKTEVFFLALKIFSTKLTTLAKEKLSNLLASVEFSLKHSRLKLKLKLIRIPSIIPKISFPRISKIKIAVVFLLTIFFSGSIFAFLFWFYILKDLPLVETLNQRKVPISSKIYDRNGVLLYTIYKNENRSPLPFDSIPLQVRLATIAIEDAEFYTHPGFSVRGIARALYKNFNEGKLNGGSTITQQLVKNTLLTPEKTLQRKLKEAVLAIQVEMAYSKDQILEMYINEVPYGGTAYGIQEASRLYFNKDVKDLTLSQAALLAGLPKSPTHYSPFGSNPESTLSRQKEVLNLMYINGFITKKQKDEAEKEEIIFAENKTDIKAPHFVFFVKEKLEETYGQEVVESGGLDIITTLDYDIQKMAEKIVKEEVQKLSKLNVTNAAVLVLNPRNGEILAMIGSKDYFDTASDGNVNVTTRLRQPGSSIKVVNYTYALSSGLTAASLVNDSPITFNVDGQPPYTPKNYEGGFRGVLTIRSALAESRNIPAVKVLASYGVNHMIEMGQKMGISTWTNPDNYGLSLTLGGGEVKLIDLAQAYATLANYGKKNNLKYLLSLKDYRGMDLGDNDCTKPDTKPIIAQVMATSSASYDTVSANPDCKEEQVVDPRIAFIITDILKDNTARTPSFGSNSLLIIPKHKEVAVKTGTSNDLRDNLAIGYNQKFLVAVWVGNNDNSPMARIASGVTGATPIWNKIMSMLLAQEENHEWEVPAGLVQVPICPYTGTLACEGCPVRQEWFLEENKPKIACSPSWFAKTDEPGTTEEKENISQESAKPTPEVQYINSGQSIDLLLQERFGKKNKLPRN